MAARPSHLCIIAESGFYACDGTQDELRLCSEYIDTKEISEELIMSDPKTRNGDSRETKKKPERREYTKPSIVSLESLPVYRMACFGSKNCATYPRSVV